MTMTAQALTSVAQLTIDIDGEPLIAGAEALASVVVEQALGLPAVCELHFDLAVMAEAANRLGPGSALFIGLAARETPLFLGDVTVVEYGHKPDGERTLCVRAYDRLHRLRKRQTVRAWVDVRPAGLAAELVGDIGLRVVAQEAGPRWARIVQGRQSDLRLLIEVTEATGLYPSVRGEELHLLTLRGTGEAIPLQLGVSLYEAELEASGEPALRHVAATGWDAGLAEPVRAEASAPAIGRTVDVAVDPAAVGGDGRRELVDAGTPSEARAAAMAQAELDRAVTDEIVLRGVADGDPRLRPGAVVEISGLHEAYQGRYVVTRTRHSLDTDRGYLVELSTAAPERRIEPPNGTRTVLGRVISVRDPDALGRVRVALTSFQDTESSWMQVVSIGAGRGKGLVALPDVDDHVLVLLPDGDPAQGVVLGGLYGGSGPHDSGVEGDAVRRYSLRSPGGHVVRLDDATGVLCLEDASGGIVELSDHRIRLADASGNEVELGRDRVRLHCVTDLEIEAPGRTITIRGGAVEFESA